MDKFRQRLKELLEDVNIKELCKYLGLKKDIVIFHWKSGFRNPKIKTLVKLANFFECSLDYLLGRTEEQSKIVGTPTVPFVEQLEHIMKKQGIKQSKMVDDKIITRSNIYDWRHDICEPTTETILKIADYLQVSVDHLVGRE